MRDAVSVPRVAALHPKVRKEVSDLIEKIESALPLTAKIRIVQGLRTKDEQDALYAQGRTKEGKIVTNAKFGQSFHCYGLAIDFAIMYDKDGNGSYETLSWDVNYDFDKDGVKDWQEVVKAFKASGWTWGGDFKSIQDDPHLEKTFGYGWRDLLALYNDKKVDEQGYVLI
jgi:peptidoglycan L-alanyl-D-glutamate endopeptidase CwlK